MRVWPPRQALEETLAETEARLAGDPQSIELRFMRAVELGALGRSTDALAAYRDLLERDPGHRGALSKLAGELSRAGRRFEARPLYERAVELHPQDAMSHANLGSILCDCGEFAAAREAYETALRLVPDFKPAHRGLCYLEGLCGNHDAARVHREAGFAGAAIALMPYYGEQPPIPALLLFSTAGGNVSTRHLLDDRVFAAYKLHVEAYDGGLALPPHRVVVNAIGDADRCAPALDIAASILARTNAPVINDPAAVAATARAAIARRLRALPGVRTPRIELVAREEIERTPELQFPLLLRSPGYHLGAHFEMIERREDLAGAVARLPGERLFAIEFIDTRRDDGTYRKFRVMCVGGEIFPVHLAISTDWKVHYYSAGMESNANARNEEAAFLAGPRGTLGEAAFAALQKICSLLNLDYVGIDLTLDANGRVVVFEANATMTIFEAPDDPMWSYRAASARRLIDAVRNMTIRRSNAGN